MAKMKKFHMTREQAEAHQRKHGFIVADPLDRLEQKKAGEPVVAPPRSLMNKTETEFSWKLEKERREGEIEGWRFQPLRLRLADGAWYTPDFMSWSHDPDLLYGRIMFYEVKGKHIREAAVVRYKVAKEQCPWADFQMWQKINGRWQPIH